MKPRSQGVQSSYNGFKRFSNQNAGWGKSAGKICRFPPGNFAGENLQIFPGTFCRHILPALFAPPGYDITMHFEVATMDFFQIKSVTIAPSLCVFLLILDRLILHFLSELAGVTMDFCPD